jgi:hypothetical protein
MRKAFYGLFGAKCKVDLKYNTIEEREKEQKEERKQKGIDEDDDDAMEAYYNRPFDEIFADLKKSSIYNDLLQEGFKQKTQ